MNYHKLKQKIEKNQEVIMDHIYKQTLAEKKELLNSKCRTCKQRKGMMR